MRNHVLSSSFLYPSLFLYPIWLLVDSVVVVLCCLRDDVDFFFSIRWASGYKTTFFSTTLAFKKWSIFFHRQENYQKESAVRFSFVRTAVKKSGGYFFAHPRNNYLLLVKKKIPKPIQPCM